MSLGVTTKEENEFIQYAIKTRKHALKKIEAILYAERDYLRSIAGNKQNIRSISGASDRIRAYMRAVENKLDEEAMAKFGKPAFVVIG